MGIQADKEETRERDDLQKKWSTLKHLNNSQVEAGSVFPVDFDHRFTGSLRLRLSSAALQN